MATKDEELDFKEAGEWAEMELDEAYDKGYKKAQEDAKELEEQEQKIFLEVLQSARRIQNFLWGTANEQWGLEEWRRMFRKRVEKIDAICEKKPYWQVELRKRLLQQACLSVALIRIIDNRDLKGGIHDTLPSNLPDYAKELLAGEDAL
jgi:hypothetical protein